MKNIISEFFPNIKKHIQNIYIKDKIKKPKSKMD